MVETGKGTSLIYQMRAYLQFLRPIVWRRFLIRSDASIEHLHQVICCLFGFDPTYPYLLRIATERYSVNYDREPGKDREIMKRPGWNIETVDEKSVPIKALVEAASVRKSAYERNIFFRIRAPDNVREIVLNGRKILDYSEQLHLDWGAVISREKELPVEAGTDYPRCLEGAWASPPSCFSGARDYSSFIDGKKRLSKRELIESFEENFGDEADCYIALVDQDFDPASFDLEKINRCLEKISGADARN